MINKESGRELDECIALELGREVNERIALAVDSFVAGQQDASRPELYQIATNEMILLAAKVYREARCPLKIFLEECERAYRSFGPVPPTN